MLTVACKVTIVLLSVDNDSISSYDLIFPDDIVTISSFVNSSFTIEVFADTNVPYTCSIALLNATLVASSLLTPSPETTNVTSSVAPLESDCENTFDTTNVSIKQISNKFFIFIIILYFNVNNPNHIYHHHPRMIFFTIL